MTPAERFHANSDHSITPVKDFGSDAWRVQREPHHIAQTIRDEAGPEPTAASRPG
jgi:hypothetical protein